MSNPLVEIMKTGQSIWYDNIRRAMITTGDLQKKIDEDDLRGVTSNPTIFEKAIVGSSDYDEQFKQLVASGKSGEEIYDALVIEDISKTADILKPVYDKTDGIDGYISLEVNPRLAYKTQETIDEADRLFKRVARKNVMIKIPASQEGLPAIEEAIWLPEHVAAKASSLASPQPLPANSASHQALAHTHVSAPIHVADLSLARVQISRVG